MFNNIKDWTIDFILNSFKNESDIIEFKSGTLTPDQLKEKISVAASAFSNSGGGILVIGINKNMEVDGVYTKIGNQYICDWIDQIVQIEPMIRLTYKVIDLMDKEKCLLIIQFTESNNAPHMAFEKKYYIRAGAHSVPASHYLIEAIRLRSKFVTPSIAWRLYIDENKTKIIKLKIFTTGINAAHNVYISFIDEPDFIKNQSHIFPLKIPFIDYENPFLMDIDIWGMSNKLWGKDSISLKLEYEDSKGNSFTKEININKSKNLAPLVFGESELHSINESLKKINESILQKE